MLATEISEELNGLKEIAIVWFYETYCKQILVFEEFKIKIEKIIGLKCINFYFSGSRTPKSC